MTDEPASAADRERARRQIIRDEVEWHRQRYGPDRARDVEREMFARLDGQRPRDRDE